MKNLKNLFFFYAFCFLLGTNSYSQKITSDTTQANLYLESARKLIPAYQFDSVHFYLDNAQPLYIKHLGTRNLKSSMVLHLKGLVCYYSAKYDSSLVYYFKSLQIRKEILGDNHLLVAASMNNIGNSYLSKSQFDLALDYFTKSYQIRLKCLGEKHVDVATSYNNIGLVYYSKSTYDKALEYHYKSLALRKELLGEQHNDVAISYNNIAVVYFFNSEYEKALEYYRKCLDIWSILFGPVHPYVATSCIGIGNVYNRRTDYNKALEHYFKSLEIMKMILGEVHPNVATIYINIGSVYFSQMEYEKALEYYFKCFGILNQLFGEKHTDVASLYNNIGNVYLSNSEYTKALEYYSKSLSIRKELIDENHIDMALSYDNIGLVNNAMNKFEAALEYHTRSLEIRKKQLGEKHIDVALSLNNLGEVYLNNKEYLKAFEYFNKSMFLRKEVFGNKNTEVSKSLSNMARSCVLMEDYSSALNYYHLAILSCLRNYHDTIAIDKVPPISDYFDWTEFLTVLHGKAQLYAIKGEKQAFGSIDNFNLSLRHYQACDTLIDRARKEIGTLSDKMTLGEQASRIYEEAIDVCLKLQNLSKKKTAVNYYSKLAFYFSEKSKSSVLLQALAGKEAQKFAGIPDSLLDKEQKLNMDIAFYSKELASPENLDNSKIIFLQNKLFDAKRKYDSLIWAFEEQYPEYHVLKYNSKVVDIEELQETVLKDNKTAIISYSVGDSSVTIFTITKKNIDIKQVDRPKNLNDTIEYFRRSIINSSKKMQLAYKKLAFDIYDLIFPKNLSRQIENLIIIPDNVLATIPFEALLTSSVEDTAQFHQIPYLIRNYKISYSYSATLFEKTFPKEKSQKVDITPLNDWIAFAPVFDDANSKGATLASRELIKQLRTLNKDTTLTRGILLMSGDYISPLPGTESEVKSIFNRFDELKYNAKVELHGNVNEKYIKSGVLQDVKIIHFATHGFANSQKPELSGIVLAQDSTGGEDGVLYAGEIYNLKTSADLVVLSACETGLGEIKKGEGIIGLTRALLYAGTKNIIVSLWQVSDESTTFLMIDFYENLLENKIRQNFSQNLQKAKLKMIAESKYAHPYFWSPFILIGK